MAAIPPSCFDWTYQGSGTPVTYGAMTVFSGAKKVLPNVSNREITYMPASGQVAGYYRFLDTRYDTPPSGWNAA